MQYNIFLLSGGTRVAVHVGAYRAICDSGATAAAWGGVSAGSLVASVFASGFSNDEAFELMLNTDYRQFLDVRPLTLIRRYGLFAGDRFETWLNDVLGGRRFRDLDVPLSIVATDIASGEPAIFSNEATPDVKVATAVRCSISIPGIFAVRHVEGRALFDGCFSHISPMELFPDSTFPSLIVRMNGTPSSAPEMTHRLNLSHYIFRVADIVLRSLRDLYEPHHWDGEIRVDAGSVSGIKFALTPDEKRLLCQRGYDACRQQLRTLQRHPQSSPPFDYLDSENPYKLIESVTNQPSRILIPG